VSYRLLASILSLCVVSCAGSVQVRETVSRPRVASSSLAASQPWPTEALKTSKGASEKSQPLATRDAKTAVSHDDDEGQGQDFSGEDTSAPVDSENDDGLREIVIEGIKGSSSEFEVRTTLDNRYEDFDHCHDRVGGGGGRISYTIHILASGDVGGVKVRTSRARNRKLVDCYTEVISSSHFPRPRGGYADVKWTTKVGRSGKKPNPDFVRPHRWDTPAGSSAKR
jgi:hypothetical protein